MTDLVWLRVWAGDRQYAWQVPRGSNLREALLRRGLSPYGRYTQRINCGGRGLCATCGVRILDTPVSPTHWHDLAADHFGYPRLSCQITLERDLEIRLISGKKLWGQWLPRIKRQAE
ncbi:MAG: hypothetical protein D6722_06010 [Bacteroidetes bacterium]|nr:MAG: hypothetical protein D6722_06010 [Bacteroidota bacterium]